MRALYRLPANAVRSLPPGKHADGGGLWLVKREDGGAQWVLRVTVHGRRREMGLGAADHVGLKAARQAAGKWRELALAGTDPIKKRAEASRQAVRVKTFGEIVTEAFEARKAELKGDGKAGRWLSPLEVHVLPRLGKVPVVEIDQTDIRDVLAPIWHAKADTARKALNRIGLALKHAAALNLEVDLQATAKARALLGRTRHKPEHIPAMPWRDVPGFYASLSDGTVTHLALRLLILTGVRSRPLRFLRIEEIDGDVWTIPAESMKGRLDKTVAFRVPLVPEALAVIEAAKRHARDGYLFPNVRRGAISDATMSRLMERAKLDARPHGFRSSLRDWIAETQTAPFEVTEGILGHTVGAAVERAYRRTDHLDARRELMLRWAAFVTGTPK